jgi:hypothetical protein
MFVIKINVEYHKEEYTVIYFIQRLYRFRSLTTSTSHLLSCTLTFHNEIQYFIMK